MKEMNANIQKFLIDKSSVIIFYCLFASFVFPSPDNVYLQGTFQFQTNFTRIIS